MNLKMSLNVKIEQHLISTSNCQTLIKKINCAIMCFNFRPYYPAKKSFWERKKISFSQLFNYLLCFFFNRHREKYNYLEEQLFLLHQEPVLNTVEPLKFRPELKIWTETF